MDLDLRGFTLLDHDGGRQHPPPGRQLRFRKGCLDLLVRVGLDAKGSQDFDERFLGNGMGQPVPALE
jgi:hypothetical protein